MLPSHRFPSQLYERIVPDYVAKAPLGLPRFSQSKTKNGVSALTTIPTAITGGIRKDVPLSFGLVARLALAGGLCSAVTKAVTSPIELRKTREQVTLSLTSNPTLTLTSTPTLTLTSTPTLPLPPTLTLAGGRHGHSWRCRGANHP